MVTISDLFESQNYNNMFNDIISFEKKYSDILSIAGFTYHLGKVISDRIIKAKKILKKNDRIVWYLRWFKAALLIKIHDNIGYTASAANFEPSDELFKQVYYNEMYDSPEYVKKSKALNIFIDLTKKFFKDKFPQHGNISKTTDIIYDYGTSYIVNEDLLRSLEHFLSLPIPEIQNYIFLHQNIDDVLTYFREMEVKWIEARKEIGISDKENIEREPIIEFSDGFVWFNLNKSACDIESDAMGHCGNSPRQGSNDLVLSLRQKIKIGDEVRWKPHLTFILDENGYLGEMKGRGNDKPSSKYHKYIIALLKNDEIRGIKGGGYMPENNFSVFDLPEETVNELFLLKPELFTLNDIYMKFGISDMLKERIINTLQENDLSIPLLELYDTIVVLKRFDNFNQFIKWCDDKPLSYLIKIYENQRNELTVNDIPIKYDQFVDKNSIVYDLLNRTINLLDKEIINKLKDYLNIKIFSPDILFSNKIFTNLFFKSVLETSIISNNFIEQIEEKVIDYLTSYHIDDGYSYIKIDDKQNLKNIEIRMVISNFIGILDEIKSAYDDDTSEYNSIATKIFSLGHFFNLDEDITNENRNEANYVNKNSKFAEMNEIDSMIYDIYQGSLTNPTAIAKKLSEKILAEFSDSDTENFL